MTLRFADAAALPAAEWDGLVAASPDGWVFALSGWQRLILDVREWGLRDHSFAVWEGASLVAVVPLQYQASSRSLRSSGWGLAGPVLVAGLDGSARAQVLAQIFARIEEMARSLGATTIEVGRSPLTESARADEDAGNPFTRFGFADCSTRTRIVDLSVGEERLWAGLSKNARQMIKRARERGYHAVQADWPSMVEDYYRVHCETYRRTGVSPHPRAYFAGLAAHMAPAGYAVLWAGYAPDGRAVAFHNDARLGQGALYHTGCSETAHLDSGVNYLLMWTAMLGARTAGCRWYEVGEVFPDSADPKSRGLTVFKSKFGGGLARSIKARRRVDVPAEPTSSDRAASERAPYEEGTLYDPSRICRKATGQSSDYVGRLLDDRLAMVRQYYAGGRLVDVCCATGVHLVDLAPELDRGIGIDFSDRYIEAAAELAAAQRAVNVSLIRADARRLPLASNSVDCLYCFSSLYAIPRAADAVAEIGRVLVPGGHAVLDFGNRRSLNVFCLRYYPDWPAVHPMTIREIRRALAGAGLRVVRRRCYQVLPLWAGRPAWLWPLLHPIWARLLKQQVLGRMLDEWISSLPGLRALAFRHVLVCRKGRHG